jgi:hypothetical protein
MAPPSPQFLALKNCIGIYCKTHRSRRDVLPFFGRKTTACFGFFGATFTCEKNFFVASGMTSERHFALFLFKKHKHF